jgi:hypothetical protein
MFSEDAVERICARQRSLTTNQFTGVGSLLFGRRKPALARASADFLTLGT